jgi:hypothetical protein
MRFKGLLGNFDLSSASFKFGDFHRTDVNAPQRRELVLEFQPFLVFELKHTQVMPNVFQIFILPVDRDRR